MVNMSETADNATTGQGSKKTATGDLKDVKQAERNSNEMESQADEKAMDSSETAEETPDPEISGARKKEATLKEKGREDDAKAVTSDGPESKAKSPDSKGTGLDSETKRPDSKGTSPHSKRTRISPTGSKERATTENAPDADMEVKVSGKGGEREEPDGEEKEGATAPAAADTGKHTKKAVIENVEKPTETSRDESKRMNTRGTTVTTARGKYSISDRKAGEKPLLKTE